MRDTIPKDPVYMSYITSHVGNDIPHTRTSSPYSPSTNMSGTELELQGSRGVYQHFHRPSNDHTRFMAAATSVDKEALRAIPRQAPPPWDKHRTLNVSVVVVSKEATARRLQLHNPQAMLLHTPPDVSAWVEGCKGHEGDPQVVVVVGGDLHGELMRALARAYQTKVSGVSLLLNTCAFLDDHSESEYLQSQHRTHAVFYREHIAQVDSLEQLMDDLRANASRPGGPEATATPLRPASASAATARRKLTMQDAMRASQHAPEQTLLVDNMTTLTGAPCYTVSAVLEADLQEGQPVMSVEDQTRLEAWRVARVETYSVPPSDVGYGEGGMRPFHQDYRHYKYYGFAGRGAKTSWGYNPKYSRIYSSVPVGAEAEPSAPAAEPLYTQAGEGRRPLTDIEKRLARDPAFSMHTYSAEGIPSDPRERARATAMAQEAQGAQGGPAPSTPTTTRRTARPASAGATVRRNTAAATIEPFAVVVNVQSTQVTPTTKVAGQRDAARVVTYRELPTQHELTQNPSPNMGSQSPWHQRYSHYKLYGFAGKGATSSWARNPKYALLHDA